MPQNEILCAKSHEFVYKKDNVFYIGVTDILINKLGKILAVEMPETGEIYTKGEIFGFLESQEAACELFMPVTGKIEAVNTSIIEAPSKMNTNSIEENWLIIISTDYFNEDKKDLICYNRYKSENLISN